MSPVCSDKVFTATFFLWLLKVWQIDLTKKADDSMSLLDEVNFFKMQWKCWQYLQLKLFMRPLCSIRWAGHLVFVIVPADQLEGTFCHTRLICVFVYLCICVFEYLLMSWQISWRIHFVTPISLVYLCVFVYLSIC